MYISESEHIRKMIDIMEARDPDIEYEPVEKPKGTLDRVIAHLGGRESAVYTRMAREYKRIDLLSKILKKKREKLNAEAKKKIEALFDAEDAVLTRVIDTASLVITMSKDYERKDVSFDVEGFIEELTEMLPDLADDLKELKEKYTKIETTQVKGKLGAPQIKMENKEQLDEGLKGWAMRVANKIMKSLSLFDKKYESLKEKYGMGT